MVTVIYEYKCGKCGETFVGDGAPTERHYTENDHGFMCGGVGQLIGTWEPVTVEADHE